MRIALIGSTGLVGSMLLPRLARAGHEVHALQRRPASAPTPGVQVHHALPDEWPRIVNALRPEVAVSALGTTMRQAGSEAGFRIVDHDMVLNFAAAARAAGGRRFVTVSSVGADAGSSNFYLRLKGEVEAELEALGFARLDIFRPGLLRGPRGKDRRLGERIGIALSPLVNLGLRGRFDRYAAIDAAVVATAIAACLADETAGTYIHNNREIWSSAGAPSGRR
jgi:uncharacterized protein YbjT (DUF2867 family)